MGHPNILCYRDTTLHGRGLPPWLDPTTQTLPKVFRNGSFDVYELEFPPYRPHAKSRRDCPCTSMGS